MNSGGGRSALGAVLCHAEIGSEARSHVGKPALNAAVQVTRIALMSRQRNALKRMREFDYHGSF